MKVVVDKETCIGCGLCAQTCPDVFEMAESIAIVKAAATPVPANSEDCAKQATTDCPVEAIKIA